MSQWYKPLPGAAWKGVICVNESETEYIKYPLWPSLDLRVSNSCGPATIEMWKDWAIEAMPNPFEESIDPDLRMDEGL